MNSGCLYANMFVTGSRTLCVCVCGEGIHSQLKVVVEGTSPRCYVVGLNAKPCCWEANYLSQPCTHRYICMEVCKHKPGRVINKFTLHP